ncbi:MAG TPA: hypothetical protein VN328_02530 [Thermodesulfovibrionales bacterium]|nr:hypothetical protein [Thermodesulfovibrionales bacterium]
MLQYARMGKGINLHILGDYGPFSRMGKSIGYQITIGQSRYLIDCGAPLFQQMGGHRLRGIKGLIVTHCHDDHKRWFSDLALFNMYAPDFSKRISLLTSEDVHQEIIRASGSALDRSLSHDSKNVIDIGYEDYINFRVLGPRARYRIISMEDGAGKTSLSVVDRGGNIVGSDKAKIVISRKTNRPRLLFKDPDYGEWIEPESFYPYSSSVFYEEDRNSHRDEEGFTLEALKSPVWHGVTSIGVKVTTDEETLIFSSDTVNDRELWKGLYTEKRRQRLHLSQREFDSSSVIYGDINDYIERVWSEERYRDAVDAFDGAVVIHDIALGKSVVHTSYERLHATSLRQEATILTHSPDKITSEWVLCKAEKNFLIRGNAFFEAVGDKLYPMNADIYHKEKGAYYVGYKNDTGRYTVLEYAGILGIFDNNDPKGVMPGRQLYRVDLYEDIGGKYFPKIEIEDAQYLERKDGEVELVEFTKEGSRGRLVEDHRERLQTKQIASQSRISVET